MKSWLKQNWFKLGLLITVLLFVTGYFYIKIREHNLDVINNIRLCATTFSDNDEAIQDCSEAMKKTYIGKNIY